MSAQVDIELRLTLTRAPEDDDEADAIATSIATFLRVRTVPGTRAGRTQIIVREAEVTNWTDVDPGGVPANPDHPGHGGTR